MKILYAIQGTGNGHLSRAVDILPQLRNRGEVDVLVSGTQADIQVPFDIKYHLKGLSFIFGKKGGIDYKETWRRNSIAQLIKEIRKAPIADYDLVVNDFEPVTAWASMFKNKPCFSLSHQAALLSHKVPKPLIGDFIGPLILRFYAPSTQRYGFHFQEYDKNIWFPVIRSAIRNAKPCDKGFYLVYLPAYSDEQILDVLNQIPEVNWYVFSKHDRRVYQVENAFVRPVNLKYFTEAMIECRGVLCGAGFETPAEALYLGKKLMVVPMKGQYEQKLNARALRELGVPVLKRMERSQVQRIRNWVQAEERIEFAYPQVDRKVVDEIFLDFIRQHYPIPAR